MHTWQDIMSLFRRGYLLSSYSRSERYFTCAIMLCVFLYFMGLCFLNQIFMLSVDEFWFAHRIYQYRDALPYRDFAPYKTVLGYYLLLPALLKQGKVFETLIFTKNIIALFNMIAFALSSFWLSRYVAKRGIIISLILILGAEITLFYSPQIRVDLIGYWFAFFALLCLLDRRFIYAGLFLGLGFITTQKTIWYLFASNIALALYWLRYQRTSSDAYAILKMNLSLIAVILAYIIFWSYFSSVTTVYNSLFQEAGIMYQLDWYDKARYLYWQAVLIANPVLFLLWPATLFCLLHNKETRSPLKNDIVEAASNDRAKFLIITQGLIILAFLIPYKQIFPYYMQVTIPILFAVYAVFFSWLFSFLKQEHKPSKNDRLLWSGLFFIYCTLFFICLITFELPFAYSIILTIPLMIVLHHFYSLPFQLTSKLVIASLFFAGFLYPALIVSKEIMKHRNNYQMETINTVEQLIHDNHKYVAGIELIYYTDQPIAGMRHLMGPAIDYLYAPTEKLKRVMLASLYLDPHVSKDSVIHDWSQEKILFYVNNYRMHALPAAIQNFLHDNYIHIGNSIYFYAPHIAKGSLEIHLKFTGHYEYMSNHDAELDGKNLKKGSKMYLTQGKHFSQSHKPYRLKLLPSVNKTVLDDNDSYDKVLY